MLFSPFYPEDRTVPFPVDAMLAKEVISFLNDFKDSREIDKDQDGVAEDDSNDNPDPDDLTHSGTNYSPSPPQKFDGYDSERGRRKRPKAITFVDEVRISKTSTNPVMPVIILL